jgi:phosphoribosylanthranilate isomerase
MMLGVWVKVCGITSVEQALFCVDVGVDAVGVNFVPSSPRRIDRERASAIARAVGQRAVVVAVVADLEAGELRRLRAETAIRWLQLCGDEPPELLGEVGPEAYKAVRIGSADDVANAARFSGDRVLVDAKVEGALGGTGQRFDWSLVQTLARERSIVLAGGLRPDNVAQAIAAVRPFGVDVASGVERAPGNKDFDAVRCFVENARRAA